MYDFLVKSANFPGKSDGGVAISTGMPIISTGIMIISTGFLIISTGMNKKPTETSL